MPDAPTTTPTPLQVALALGLYAYQFSPFVRASHLRGVCRWWDDYQFLVWCTSGDVAAMPRVIARAYVSLALRHKGAEAAATEARWVAMDAADAAEREAAEREAEEREVAP